MSEPNAAPAETTRSVQPEDDEGAALERAAKSIREAQDAEGKVAAADDIRTRDDERAGAYSEDPGGEGGHP